LWLKISPANRQNHHPGDSLETLNQLDPGVQSWQLLVATRYTNRPFLVALIAPLKSASNPRLAVLHPPQKQTPYPGILAPTRGRILKLSNNARGAINMSFINLNFML
jgi:hypothetical protein